MIRIRKKLWLSILISALVLVSFTVAFANESNGNDIFPDSIKLAPSRVVLSDEFSLRNTSDSPIKLNGHFDYEITKFDNLEEQLASKYFIRFNGEGNLLPSSWMPLDEVNEYIADLGTLPSKDMIQSNIEVKLDESAGNEYQSAILHLNFKLNGKGMEDGGALPGNPNNPEKPDPSKQPDLIKSPSDSGNLPNTATNMYNTLLIGLITLAIGLVVMYFNSIKMQSAMRSLLLFMRGKRNLLKGGETE